MGLLELVLIVLLIAILAGGFAVNHLILILLVVLIIFAFLSGAGRGPRGPVA